VRRPAAVNVAAITFGHLTISRQPGYGRFRSFTPALTSEQRSQFRPPLNHPAFGPSRALMPGRMPGHHDSQIPEHPEASRRHEEEFALLLRGIKRWHPSFDQPVSLPAELPASAEENSNE
jgi:hypothetical protein